MKSMTGHGRGSAKRDGHQALVELSTVNRKQFELACGLPRGFSDLEPKVRELVSSQVQRGRVNCSITWENATGAKTRSHRIDHEAATAYFQELEALRKKLKLKDPISLDLVMRGPGIIREEAKETEVEKYWPVLQEALQKALRQLLKMREAEGRNLAEDFARMLAGMEKVVAEIATHAPQAVERYRQALHKRVREAGVELAREDERLLKEVVLFADRADITEELTRLRSHFQQFHQILKSKEPVGRTLEFLTQEMNREINTIGAKANDLDITQGVMHLKGELEKIREQIQNIE